MFTSRALLLPALLAPGPPSCTHTVAPMSRFVSFDFLLGGGRHAQSSHLAVPSNPPQLVTNEHKSGRNMRIHLWAALGYVVVVIDGRGSARRGIHFESRLKHKMVCFCVLTVLSLSLSAS